MLDREDLKQFTRKELEDIILSSGGSAFFERQVEQLIKAKVDEKLQSSELEIETMCRHKEEYLKSLKRKYNVSDDKELFAKMNYEEKFEYIKKLGEIDKAHDRLFKIYDEENERFNKKYKKWNTST